MGLLLVAAIATALSAPAGSYLAAGSRESVGRVTRHPVVDYQGKCIAAWATIVLVTEA
jgi:hypothetical protein